MKPNVIELAIDATKKSRAHIQAELILNMDVDNNLVDVLRKLDFVIDTLDSVNTENKTRIVD